MSLVPPGQEQTTRQDQKPSYRHPHESVSHFQGFHYQPEMCRRSCGYYGNPAWHGYCSKCWIERRQKRQDPQPLTDGQHTGNQLGKPGKEVTGEQWNRADPAREFISSTNSEIVSFPPSTSLYRPVTPVDATDAVFRLPRLCLSSLALGDFSAFLKALRKPESQQLLARCTDFIQRLQSAEDTTLDAKAEEVQGFYQRIADHFPDHMTEERDRLLDNIEKLVMTQLYKSVFCPDGSQDEQKDLSLQKRIRSLHWVTPKMLQLPLNEENQETKDKVFAAVTALIEMDSKRAPQDKLTCITKASDCLFKAIRGSKREPATADDFLSCLIYTMLRANPTRLSSNLQYITRFCNPPRLVTGEAGYCFTNLCCSVAFIEALGASSLGLAQDEFDHLMQEQSPEVTQRSDSEQSTVHRVQQNKKLLAELRCRQDVLIQKAGLLEREVRAWPLSVQEEVQEIIRRFPLNINRTSASLN
ncbi:hypothetical protein FKM82_005196 [Ascaphus truei]